MLIPSRERSRDLLARQVYAADVVETMLALAATFFLDWPVSEDKGSASASATGAAGLSPSLPVEVELPPRKLSLRLRVDQLVLHRLPPRVQAC